MGDKKDNCSGPQAFKSQRVAYQSIQKLRIIVTIQIMSSIHTIILKIQQRLESREPVPHPEVFWPYLFLEVKDCIV